MKALYPPLPLLVLALLATAGMAYAIGNCTVALRGDDAMTFDLKTAAVSASCAKITVALIHLDKLPVAVMGHNVGVSTTADFAGVTRNAIKADVTNHYVP